MLHNLGLRVHVLGAGCSYDQHDGYPFTGESSVTTTTGNFWAQIKAIEKLNPESSEAEESTERICVTGKDNHDFTEWGC